MLRRNGGRQACHVGTALGMRRGSWRKCWGTSTRTAPTSSCRRCTPRSSPGRRCCGADTGRHQPALAPDAVPAHLRELEIPSGCAADYDAWLVEVRA